MSTYKDFHHLPIWIQGYELLMRIYSTSESFPTHEQYALGSQIKRSANSIIANIAESHGRYSFQDKIRVLYIARGEITETRSHIAVAYGQHYIDESTFTDLNNRYTMLTKQLNLYINTLQRKS
jgi:four helix bundle protein